MNLHKTIELLRSKPNKTHEEEGQLDGLIDLFAVKLQSTEPNIYV